MVQQIISLHKPTISISEDHAIKVLIMNVQVLLRVGIVHSIIYSSEFHEFIIKKIYDFGASTLVSLLHIVQYIVENNENRKQLIIFFEK